MPKPIQDRAEYKELVTGDTGYGSSCNRCGVFVVDETIHTNWHADIEKLKAPAPKDPKAGTGA